MTGWGRNDERGAGIPAEIHGGLSTLGLAKVKDKREGAYLEITTCALIFAKGTVIVVI